MDLTPAEKRKLTIEAKREKAQTKKLELQLMGAKVGRPTKEFTEERKKRTESAITLQNLMRGYKAKKNHEFT